MKIIIIEWESFGREDIKTAFRLLGHTVVTFAHPDYDLRQSEAFEAEFYNFLLKNDADIVFSSNYFPLVSKVCEKINKPYAAWVYDCPHLSLYSATVINKCNHIFIFDSATYNELYNQGINTVHYLPLAADTDRLDSMAVTPEIRQKLDCEISFVGSMYDEKHRLFDRLERIGDYARGYLDGIMKSQLAISGYNFIEELLSDRILAELRLAAPYTPNADGVETDSYIYSRYFIDRKLTEIERKNLLNAVSDFFRVNLYTHNPTPYLPKVRNMGPVDPVNVMPYVFKCSKINLNITLRSIYAGIPLRALDIMGAGGFLMTNYQSDMNDYFTDGVDYCMYDGADDLIDKCRYYLEHEDERLAIAQNGHDKIKAHHTYVTRLRTILEETLTAKADPS